MRQHFFSYRDGQLFCEDVPVEAIAKAVGTPVYIYSRATIDWMYRLFDEAFSGVPHLVCFSVKSCSSLAILRLLHELGSGFDIVSGGELYRVLRAGGNPSRVVFAGVGKTEEEIRLALRAGILLFNVESEEELATINRIAGEMKTIAPIGLRLNPDIDARTHAKTTTGKKENKFGIDPETASRIVEEIDRYPHVRLLGVDAHLGSPVPSFVPYARAVEMLVAFAERYTSERTPFTYLDCGGGFPLRYHEECHPTISEYALAIISAMVASGRTLILEPGRAIVGNAAVLVTTVQYMKHSPPKTFAIVDAGMNTLIRPAMYDAYHFIWPTVTPAIPPWRGLIQEEPPPSRDSTVLVPTDVVGPICESSDCFAKGRPLPPLARGDRLAIFSAGAYGFTMSSQYNSHPRPPEVLVEGASWRVIRERENYEDLVTRERI